MIKLPNGDYINMGRVENIQFDCREDAEQVKHLVCKISFVGDYVYYRDNDAIFIKDYLEKYCGEFFLIHEQDYAVQTLALGLALEMIEDLSGGCPKEISERIIQISNSRIKELSHSQIRQIRKNYEDNFGHGPFGVLDNLVVNLT